MFSSNAWKTSHIKDLSDPYLLEIPCEENNSLELVKDQSNLIYADKGYKVVGVADLYIVAQYCRDKPILTAYKVTHKGMI